MGIIHKPPTGSSGLKKQFLNPDNSISRPEPLKYTGQEFYAETETATHYVAHETKPRYQHPKAAYVPSGARLDGLTNTQNDYRPWPVSVPQRHQPAKYQPQPGGFEAVSTSQTDYSEKPLPPLNRRVQQYVNSGENMGFATATSSGSDPTGAEATVYKGGFKLNSVKLDAVTSQQNDFKAWPVAMPERRQPLKYQPQPGVFDGTTTNKADFSQKQLPTFYVRPRQDYQKSPHKMESITTQSDSYQQWQVAGTAQRYRTAQVPRPGAASIVNIGERG
ncbi:hypothetical protein HDV03_004304 [Kappamyces sp. JEL0829]|nr:hypothetical protein HDV03_004304 [Kappamyces sp. JEL0829]